MRSVVAWSLATIGVAAVGFAALHGVARNEQVQPAPHSEPATEALAGDAAFPGHAGMRVSIEPETGELVVPASQPQKAQELELQEMLSRSSLGLHEEALPDGGVKVNLQGRFQNASIAVIDGQGNLHTSCVETPEDAQAARQGRLCTHAKLEDK
jgi:hypothetical protein